MDINKDCHAFHLAFRVPDEESSRLDVFFEAHERFMRETHFTEGETEPRVLVYNITKCPELKNPLNPDEGTTGYTLFGLHEVYRGPEGCAAHMAAGQAREALFAEFVDLVQTYMVSGLLAAPVIRTIAKYGNAAFKGMVDTPQDREAAANKLFNAMGVKMHNIYFSVSSAEIVRILEGNSENMAALEMVTMSTGTFTSIDAKEVIDSKSMTAAMETANKAVSAYQAPNQ